MNVWKRYGARETVIMENGRRSRREKTVENRNGIKVPANWQLQQFLVCRCGSDRGGKMEPSAGKLTDRKRQINLEIEDPASSFAGDSLRNRKRLQSKFK